MAIEERFSTVRGSLDPGRIPQYVSTVAWLVSATVVVFAWLAFWGIVVRLHVQMGDFLPAGLVVGFFVIPAIVGFGLYLRRSLPLG